jgi:UDP:flavonoid glycosyltransferase YjiC (YdhE family)
MPLVEKDTNFDKIQATEEKHGGKPRILVAPLDWGLGHATRCIPIIRQLLQEGADVLLAAGGPTAQLLQVEFPALEIIPLQGYRVRYASTRTGMFFALLSQVPRILRVIYYEHRWLKSVVKKHAISAVLSDNRFGLYHAKIPCVFITHQLQIKSPLGKWTESWLRRFNFRYINRFSECWVPDLPGTTNLAGDLSHPEKQPAIPVFYIGPLSRLLPLNIPEKEGHVLILLSGPEPQRSLLENKVLDDLARYPGTATLVRGLPGSVTLIPSSNQIRIYNHLPAKALNEEMQAASLVISRCGYSTVMDLVNMKKKSVLIPTPGQTEQEYLAGYLTAMHIAYCKEQSGFSLTAALQAAKEFPYHFPETDAGGLLLQVRIKNFLTNGLKTSGK